MNPAPELSAGRRHALVIATSAYEDGSLRRLRAPARDADDLASVLADPAIGSFAVTPLMDRPVHDLRVQVVEFLSNRSVDDLLLVYLSCHGLRDGRGRLYFASADTRRTHLAATGVEAGWLLEQLEECRSRRQVSILDCCFSGAFARRAKGDGSPDLEDRIAGFGGGGRAVLTASRAEEHSFEGEPLPGVWPVGSVYTTGLVEGLRTGEADTDRDGLISVEDAHDYAAAYVKRQAAEQTEQCLKPVDERLGGVPSREIQIQESS